MSSQYIAIPNNQVTLAVHCTLQELAAVRRRTCTAYGWALLVDGGEHLVRYHEHLQCIATLYSTTAKLQYPTTHDAA